jgi:hypothetical protein
VSSGPVSSPGLARARTVGTILWALIPALSFGFLVPVPFAHGAIRLKQQGLWAVTAAYTVVCAAEFGLPSEPEGGWGDTATALAMYTLMIVGTIHAFVLRGRVFARRDPALVAALVDREEREEAKAIATRDPALARELRIGRPDLPRQFDEGCSQGKPNTRHQWVVN